MSDYQEALGYLARMILKVFPRHVLAQVAMFIVAEASAKWLPYTTTIIKHKVQEWADGPEEDDGASETSGQRESSITEESTEGTPKGE